MFLDNGRTGHRVVQCLEIAVDGLGGNLLAESPGQRLVSGVKTYDNRTPDLIPHLLHCGVVDVVEVIAFTHHVGPRDIVRHELPLAEGHTAEVDVDVVRRYSTVLGDFCAPFLELALVLGLSPPLALIGRLV